MNAETIATSVVIFFNTLGALALSACMASAGESTKDDLFDQYEVVTDTATRQTVLTGFLLGGSVAELVVVHIDENEGRRVRIYSHDDGTGVLKRDAMLRPEVVFVDVANIDGRDRLITYGGGRMSWFDPDSAMERAMVAVTSSFDPPGASEISHVDVTQDVNDDDRDDLVVPDGNGFWVFVQIEDGGFADR